MKVNVSLPPKTYRKELVQFLFSLCVAQIAISFADLATVNPLFSVNNLGAIAHLCLALILIWASWFGWRKSVEAQSLDEGSLLSRAAILTLFDLALVILYFMLIRSADIVKINLDGRVIVSEVRLESPSPHRESRVLFFVFVMYFLWDCISKCPRSWPPWKPGGEGWKWPYPSLVCTLIIAAMLPLTAAFHKIGHVGFTVLFDAALALTVLLFRWLKEIQNWRILELNNSSIENGRRIRFYAKLALFTILLIGVMCVAAIFIAHVYPGWIIV